MHRIYFFKDILACLRLNDVGIPCQVLEMEKKVLDRLKFELAGPTTKTFLRFIFHIIFFQFKISIDASSSYNNVDLDCCTRRFVRAAQAGQKVKKYQF